MKIIISSAKKMNEACDHDFAQSRPRFEKESQSLREALGSLSRQQLKTMYGCSERTLTPVYAALTREKQGLIGPESPALLSYEGIAFRSMAPGVFTSQQWDYANRHLRILSALYGVLRPLDAIRPYRLEMAQKLPGPSPDQPALSLYDFWKERLAKAFENETIINLASKEYSKALTPFGRWIDVRFYEEEPDGKRKEKGVYAKIARGTMVRWLAENQVEQPERMKDFQELGYRFDPDASNDHLYVFWRKQKNRKENP